MNKATALHYYQSEYYLFIKVLSLQDGKEYWSEKLGTVLVGLHKFLEQIIINMRLL
jgi:hypothetical protein